MKKAMMLTVLLASSLSSAQVPAAKGEIQTGPSLPGTLGFVITGEPARLIYDQLSSVESEDPYYGPGKVKMKTGNGISCRLPADQKMGSWCEVSVTPKGILIF